MERQARRWQSMTQPRWLVAVGLAGAVALGTVVWVLGQAGPVELMAQLRLVLAFAALFAGLTFGLVALWWPGIAHVWRMVTAAHVVRAALRSGRTLAFGLACLTVAAVIRSDRTPWWQDA